MQPVYVPRDPHEKAIQRALMQYRLPSSQKLVREALHRAHREGLIGYGPQCLVRPDDSNQKLDGRHGRTAGRMRIKEADNKRDGKKAAGGYRQKADGRHRGKKRQGGRDR